MHGAYFTAGQAGFAIWKGAGLVTVKDGYMQVQIVLVEFVPNLHLRGNAFDVLYKE